jgi:uncharacterized membrane protein
MLLVGLVIFMAVHSVSIVAPAWRDRTAARLGEWPWKALYGALSLAGFLLIVYGYGAARLEPTVLYLPPPWLRHVAFALLLAVFPLMLATYLPGRIKSTVKNPTLMAVKVWALAHLLVNGTLADVALFGAFLAWAVADVISVRRRAQRPLPGLPASKWNDALAIAGGLVLYAVFALWLHPLLIGVQVTG